MIAFCLVICALTTTFCMCGRTDRLDLPNGDYVACDENGATLEAIRLVTVFTINGKSVSPMLSENLPLPDGFKGKGIIEKDNHKQPIFY